MKTTPEIYAGIRVPTTEQIKKVCCDVFDVDNFIVDNRKQDTKVPRQVFCYLMRKHSPMSFERIGEIVHRNHATVLSSVKLVKNTYLNDRHFKPYVEQCENMVNQMIIDHKNIDQAKDLF